MHGGQNGRPQKGNAQRGAQKEAQCAPFFLLVVDLKVQLGDRVVQQQELAVIHVGDLAHTDFDKRKALDRRGFHSGARVRHAAHGWARHWPGPARYAHDRQPFNPGGYRVPDHEVERVR